MANIYAVLVGINAYKSIPLNGCLNDVEALSECLIKLYSSQPGTVLKIKKITDNEEEKPTRNNIIAAFDFFNEANAGDECLFYYSGHGSYANAPVEFQSSNGQVQSLVCLDSRDPGGMDLIDKELGYLIWKTCQTRPGINFVAITDCCHSGTITKALVDRRDVTERMMRSDDGQVSKKVEDYLGFGEEINGVAAYPLTVRDGKTFIPSVQGDHIHLAASRDYQTAKELPLAGGKVSGAFTFSLIEQLYRTEGKISYRGLVDRIRIQINNIVDDQIPGLNPCGKLTDIDGDRIFLGKSLAAESAYQIYYDKNIDWSINAGPIHNVYPGDQLITLDGKTSEVLLSVSAGVSKISNPNLQFGGVDNVWSAQVIRKKSAKFMVGVPFSMGFPTAAEFNKFTDKDTPLYFEDDQIGRFVIGRNDLDEIYLSLGGGTTPLFLPVRDFSIANLSVFLESTELVARSLYLRELEGTGNESGNQPYTVRVFKSRDNAVTDEANFEEIDTKKLIEEVYYQKNGKSWNPPAIKISITNNRWQRLWVSNAYLGFDHSIIGNLFSPVEITINQTAWLTFSVPPDSDLIYLQIDSNIRELNYTEVTEFIKLFIAAEQIETKQLTQDGVKLPEAMSKDTNRLIKPRGAVPRPVNEPKSPLWYTETLGFNIIQPLDDVTLGDEDRQLGGLKVKAHSSFRANASLNSSQLTSRNADGIAAPSQFNSVSGMQPFDILGTERNTTVMDVIELYNISGEEGVDREHPLIFSIGATRGIDNSNILPVGFDSQTKLYFPLGYTDSEGNIIIEVLPSATRSDQAVTQRSFFKSIKLYFQKVVGQKLGFSYNYPRLAIASVNSELNVSYDDNIDHVKKKVESSTNIILFIHGIIGDTEGMLKCIKMPIEGKKTLEKVSDLVLSFDYENLNTPIQNTADQLYQKLNSVGFVPGHGKKITIIAHSMGGLVSRSMIERHPGLINSLVMLGTPNNGTPWADVRDLAATLITYAINGASLLKPWMFLLSGIGKLVNGIQVTLKEMDAEDGIYGDLNTGKDPQILYTIIAGNTQDIITAYKSTSELIERRFAAIVRNSVYSSLDKLLFHLPNDIAVSDESITTFKEEPAWAIKPVIHIVPSDHLNYFTNANVVSILAETI